MASASSWIFFDLNLEAASRSKVTCPTSRLRGRRDESLGRDEFGLEQVTRRGQRSKEAFKWDVE